jgi:peptidyl-prolyl cis-trans isomerase SurA
VKRALLALLVCASLAAGARGAERIDGVAAVVDKDVILLSEVDTTAAPVLRRLERERGPLPPEAVRQVKSEALQSLIDEHLILSAAARMQMQTTPEEIDAEVARIAADEQMTPEQVYAEAERHGLAREKYREQLGNQITKMKVMSNAVGSRVSVTDEEVRALYDKRYGGATPGVRARALHILIPWGADPKANGRDEVRALARKVREAAVAGSDFGALARQYSRIPSAAGGGLTVFREGEVSPELAPFVFGAAPGEISEPIETEYGVNVLQVLDRFDPTQVSYEQVKNRLRAEIADGKARPELERWLEDLRKHRYIEVIAPELR